MVIEVRKLAPGEFEKLGVANWDIWECDVSTFPWTYAERESCYILEGEVAVTAGAETVSFGKGDFVVFPKGLSCTWKVTGPVRKHYLFG